MRAINKRLNHTTEVRAIDFEKNEARLVQPNSKPTFIYKERLENITILENTLIVLDGVEIYEGDIVRNKKGMKFKVEKVPGGYFPFAEFVKETFRKVN